MAYNNDPLFINNEMAGFDRKDRAYYDKLTDEQKKKFSTFLMLKWGANVSGSADMQGYYIMSCNERLNKNFFDIGKHPKLQWLLCTTVSPDMGTQRHYWLKTKKSEGNNNKLIKFLEQQYPTFKRDEIELMVELNDRANFEELARGLGYSDKEIKTLF